MDHASPALVTSYTCFIISIDITVIVPMCDTDSDVTDEMLPKKTLVASCAGIPLHLLGNHLVEELVGTLHLFVELLHGHLELLALQLLLVQRELQLHGLLGASQHQVPVGKRIVNS